MYSYQDYVIKVPTIWDRNWEDAIDKAEGIEKTILVFQARAANLLKSIDDFKATPDRLAWLSLWTKAFSAIDSVWGALERNSEYVLEIVSRVAFETLLHVKTIAEPLTDNITNLTPDSYKKATDRLRAYTVWCCWNDQQYYKEYLNFRNMEATYDAKPSAGCMSPWPTWNTP